MEGGRFLTKLAAEIIIQEFRKNMQIIRLFTLFPKMPLFVKFANKLAQLMGSKVGHMQMSR